jgi:O-antigen ligase
MPLAAGSPGVERAGAILVALLAAGALVAPSARVRAWAITAALLVAPALLLVDVWDTAAFRPVRDRPLVALAGAVVVVVGLAGGAALLAGRPTALAVAAVAAMPFRLPITIGATTANLLVPLYAVIAAGALGYAVPRLLRGSEESERPRRPGPVEWLLAASVVLYAVQAAYAADVAAAVRNLVFFYVPFALLFALLGRLEWTARLVRACAAVLAGLALVFAAVGFGEYALGAVLWNDRLIESNAYNTYFRVNSLFYDPNIYGRFLVVVMLFAGAVVAWTRSRRDALAAGGLMLVLWGALLTTLSQSSFGAVLVGLGVLAALRGHVRVVAAGATLAAVAAVALVAAAPGAVSLATADDVTLREATSGRSDLVRGGAELFAKRPLLGWGAGSFETEYRRLRGLSGARDVSASHTIPITVAAEQGVAGLVAYLALLAVAFAALLRGAGRSPARAAIAAAFAALVFHTLVYAAFLEDPLAWALLAAGVALAARLPATAHDAARRAAAGRDPAPVT